MANSLSEKVMMKVLSVNVALPVAESNIDVKLFLLKRIIRFLALLWIL